MPQVRSQSLFAQSGLTNVLAWTGPDGMVTLVKGIGVSNRSAAPATIQLTLQTPTGATVMIMSQSIASGEVVNLQVWHAMNPGDNLYAASSPSGLDAWISGAVLVGPPPIPRPSDLATTLPA